MADRLALASIAGLTLGIGVATGAEVSWAGVSFVLLIALVCGVALFITNRAWYWLPVVFLVCLAIGCVRGAFVPHGLPLSLEQQVGSTVTISGTIDADPDVRESTKRVTVAVGAGEEQTRIIAVTDRYQTVSYGDLVTVTGHLKHPEPFDTDGGRTFNYPMFLAKDGVFGLISDAQLRVTGQNNQVLVRGQRALFDIKEAFVRGVESALPEPHASLAVGVLTGGKQGLGNELLDAFTITGLLPIIVLSGYNVMIVAESILILLAALPRRIGYGVAGVTILLFVLAAGGGSSAVRAGIMAVLAVIARASTRIYDALRALIAVFVLMLLWNPLYLLYDPGFQFSFAATIGLILVSPLFAERLVFIRSDLLREVIATTGAAQLVVLPLLLYQTGNLSLVSIAANVLILPIVPLTMLLSFVSGVVGIGVPLVAPYVGVPAYVFLSYIIGVAQVSAALPLAHVIVPFFSAWLLIPAYAGIALLVWRLRSSPLKGASQ